MTRPTFTLRQRLRYAFDNTLSKGTPALIFWLTVASFVFVAGTAAIVKITGASPVDDKDVAAPLGFTAQMWNNLMRTLDAGTMGGDNGTGFYLFMMVVVTLGGVFIVGTLIGLISNGVGNQIDELRKGRGLVAETDHIVILGWSPQIFAVVGELVLGNENRKGNCIAILADRDKVEMEDELRDRISDLKTTRIVCRRGLPNDLGDLKIVNFNAARAIVILSPEGDDPDNEVIKSILAVTNHPQRRTEPFHIVAEIREHRNMAPARLVGKDEAQLIETGDVIARVVAQTCRQTGLSTVYTELLDYGGDEIYFKAEPSLTGKTFADSQFAFDTCAVIGVKRVDGAVQLNPPKDSVYANGDQVIVIAKDLAAVRTGGPAPAIDRSLIAARTASAPQPERTLMLGWNRRAAVIVRELDGYVAPGSQLTVVAEGDGIEEQLATIGTSLKNQRLEFRIADTTDREVLESTRPESYQHIIVLSYSEHRSVQQADAATLVTLLNLRDIETLSGANRYSIVTEMLDMRNRELAEVTQADDFIVSERMTSLLMAQVTENKDLRALFDDIFDADGSEIYLKPASDYVTLGTPVSFWHIVEAARERGQAAIGFRLASGSTDAAGGYGVSVNPPKSTTVTFSAEDRIIVVAED